MENLDLGKSSGHRDGALAGEIVLVNFLVDESLSNVLDLLEVSEVDLGLSIGLWESKLGLDLSWHERKGLSSIVLHSSWSRHVHVWTKVMVAVRVHSKKDKWIR